MAYADSTAGGRVIEQGWGRVEITLSAACEVGDLLGQSANTWVKADMNSTIKVYAELIAGTAGASGAVITAYKSAVVSGVTGATVGKPVFAVNNAGETGETPGTAFQQVGYALSTTQILLNPDSYRGGIIPAGGKYEILSAADTMDVDDCAKTIMVDTDAVVITLPAVATGLHFKVMNIAADGTALVSVSPNSADRIFGNGFTASDDKDAQNTKATAKYGDYIVLDYYSADGWVVTEVVGTWAREG